MTSSVSVVLAAYNAAPLLQRSLESIAESAVRPLEVIVVDDCSTDNSAAVAEASGATVMLSDKNGGPARARNRGARAANGDILFFIDSDVCLHRDTLELVLQAFAADGSLDALIGAYDDEPDAPGFLSQYRNLMHCFVHRSGSQDAFTFWTGCGAVRRDVFLEFGGFDQSYARPSIEDIELGYRLVKAGRRIRLLPTIQVKHLKRWTFWQMVKTDVLDRGIPWTELILRHGRMQNDLNLQIRQRVSVILVYILLALCFTGYFLYTGLAVLLCCVLLNSDLYKFLVRRRGYLFALAAIPLHLLYHLYNGVSFGVGFLRWGWSRACS